MVAQLSGLTTLYTASDSMSTRSAVASASAPPEPPSPMITATSGTVSPLIAIMSSAMAAP